MARILSLLLVCAVLCMSGCSLTYKKRVTKEADIGQATVLEYGLFGMSDTDSETPGGLIPLFRSEKPLAPDN